MRVFVTGATGFVGQYVVAALHAQGHEVVALVRPGHRARLKPLAQDVSVVYGDVTEASTLEGALRGCEAVINLVGILREAPLRGISFERVHVEGTRNLIEAARMAGIRRFVQMSANGVKPEGTPYQVSKYAAEQLLKQSGLDWTIFRPSVIVGDTLGRTGFVDEIAQLMTFALFFPLFGDGAYRLQPICVTDVAAVFARSLSLSDSIRQVYALGGPEVISYRELVARIARAVGKPWLPLVPSPLPLVRLAVDIGELIPGFPLGATELTMLLEGNRCEDNRWAQTFGLTPGPCDAAALRYVRHDVHAPWLRAS